MSLTTIAMMTMTLSGYTRGPAVPLHDRNGPKQCPLCDKTVTGRIALSQHLRDKHGFSRKDSKP